MQLTPQQQNFFETFGFLVFPGLLKDEIDWITAEFRAVFDDKGLAHSPDQRTCVPCFIDQREKLSSLVDHPAIAGIAASLLGEDFNYMGSDGNYYTGDTGWHSDGWHDEGRYLKIALYLDPVKKESGCLRVIPGTHRTDIKNWPARSAGGAPELWNVAQSEVPCVALESNPGDVVAFNHNLMHAAFGGNTERRMFTLNLSDHADTSAKIGELKDFVSGAARFWIDNLYGPAMLATASSERHKHLRQVLENSDHLPALAAKARAEMSEPARG